jgi:signal transduction histidine kinase
MHEPQSPSGPMEAATLPLSRGLAIVPPRVADCIPDNGTRNSRTTELVHDARNLIAALNLYCDLLAAPGVLATGFGEYAGDLRLLAGIGAKLLAAFSDVRPSSPYSHTGSSSAIDRAALRRRPLPEITDLAAELIALEPPLRALAGPGVRLDIECAPCPGRLALSSEDLLRILFNLVANAVEAMAATPAELRRRPFVRITVQRGGAASFLERGASLPDGPAADHSRSVVLSVRDNGPGVPACHLPQIFDAGFSTRSAPTHDARTQASDDPSRGLGLAIVRRLVTAAGGAVRAVCPTGLGARFDIELPVLSLEADNPPAELAAPVLMRKIPGLQ